MKSIHLVSWNVNGIRAVERKGAFANIMETLKPDMLCVQETKAQPDVLSVALLNPDGYQANYVSAERKGYSGVALFSKEAPLSVTAGLGIERFDSEGRTLVADFGEFELYNIYYPNGKANKDRLQYKMDFYDAFQEHVEKRRQSGKSVVICGDVNTAHKEIDLARPTENSKTSGFLPKEREWIDQFLALGYIDTLREFHSEPELYTWWDLKTRARERNVGWRIDYFYISEDLRGNLKDAVIYPEIVGSDHCPIGIKLEF
ncbi:MAG: exodeoxyribonuclease III [Anaerolineaceae bacterium]|nr:exodeoxyribonuclease III [Anaerolineaceae bacterium]